jgi:D-glycero-D-manno-heptose 1,7-bisphosphate phosphatase
VGRIGEEVSLALPESGTPVSKPRGAVFFDRDGTLNEDVDFLGRPDQLRIILGAVDAVRAVNRSGMAACIISNQSGVARGMFTEADLLPVHERLRREFSAGGAKFDRIDYCPHHPTAGIPPYRIECECRKPKPGMLLRAADALGLDLSRSYVIGDKLTDLQAGISAGASAILVLTGYGITSMEECRTAGVTPDYVAPTVREAVEFILATEKEKH